MGALFGILLSSCVLGNSPQGPANEITELADKVEEATYAAVYRFGFTRQLAPGISHQLEIVQQPPAIVRKVETTTTPEEGKPVTNTAWYIKNADGDFVCTSYEEIGIRCQKDPIALATFGSAKYDIFFDRPREPNAFSSVRKAPRPVRIQGQQGTCFEAIPVTATPVPASPQPTPERFRFELCYAEDGILLRGRRTTLDEGGPSDNSESFVEAVSLSRVVEPDELRLPGDLVDPGDLLR